MYRVGLAAAIAVMVASCSGQVPPHLKPIPPGTMKLLASNGIQAKAPIFIRIFKEESELEVWKQAETGRFTHVKTYPICNWSGGLGPKLKQGDKQSPEGFYTVSRRQLNPKSSFHLAFNLGYPNTFDKANGRTGDFLMVHGDCKSVGCYAMTDALVEEIYALAREALNGGQQNFHVHAFPFRMTVSNLKRHRRNKWYRFWRRMKPAYDHFEVSRQIPKIDVCDRNYLINAKFINDRAQPRPTAVCPAYETIQPEPFGGEAQQQIASRVVVQGRKMRAAMAKGNRRNRNQSYWNRYGLTKSPKSWFSFKGSRQSARAFNPSDIFKGN